MVGTTQYRNARLASSSPYSGPLSSLDHRLCHVAILGDLEQACRSHAAANAHGDDHVADTASLALDQGMSDHASPAHAVRVADRDGTAVHVQPLVGNPQPVAAVDYLTGKGLIQLPQIDIFHAQAVALEKFRNRKDWPDSHLVRFT